MEEIIKDLNYFEVYQTEYMRSIKLFDEMYESKYVYVTTEKDDEYGYPVFRNVSYTFDKAFSNACQTYTINRGWRHDDYKYDFLLVNTQDIIALRKENDRLKQLLDFALVKSGDTDAEQVA